MILTFGNYTKELYPQLTNSKNERFLAVLKLKTVFRVPSCQGGCLIV